jgi:AcrR family transcriptional regulator
MATRTRRRADAERSIAKIITAARATLGANPNATIDDIARAAGVGRMTLYGHFPSRADLIDATFAHAVETGEQQLAKVDLSGNANDALARLLSSSWELVAESAALLEAAQEVLPPSRILELHEAPALRVEQLIRRGQAQGAFRTDLPIEWLVNVLHYVIHGASQERRAGRLREADAAKVVTASAQALLAASNATTR